jgi:hypothetical protein
MGKITFQKEEKQINYETGEITKHTVISEKKVESEPPYVKMYVNDIVRINNLPGAAGKVLNVLVANMTYGNTVVLIAPIKEIIVKETGLSINTINKAITQLNDTGIIIRSHRSVYVIDPTLFAKGRWQDIKQLQLTISYGEDGKKEISSNAVEQLKLV